MNCLTYRKCFSKGTHGQVREVSDRVLPQCPLGILIPGGGIGGGPQDAVRLEEFLGIFWNYLGLPWGTGSPRVLQGFPEALPEAA